MPSLSNPITDLKAHYAVVIVGSGYGGAIAASRLARAGQQVCVLERGKEFQPGDFPNTLLKADRETQWDTPVGHIGSPTGLYDFRVNPDLNVFVGCGLGGTSLINANVALRPDPRVLQDPRWPQAFRDDVGNRLERGFQRAEEMLKATPYPRGFPRLAKLVALEQVANHLNEPFSRPPLTVNFTRDGPNHVGVDQHPCELCGDCVSGCNYGAKNTLSTNYLPDAKNHGAELFTCVRVGRLKRQGKRWLVFYQLLGLGREDFRAPEMFVAADLVILSAGSLGSTEILLRSRPEVSLSDRLGEGFTGNGDAIGFAYNCQDRINAYGYGDMRPGRLDPVGPCITGLIDARADRPVKDGLIIEEGSPPGAIARLASATLNLTAEVRPGNPPVLRAARRASGRLVGAASSYRGASRRTLVFLVNGHDDDAQGAAAAGRLVLQRDRLRVSWPGVGAKPHFRRIDERLRRATEALQGTFVPNPLSMGLLGHPLITVHPLGGCNMAEQAEAGVVNDRGQVFSGPRGTAVYPDLYVCDGSAITTPLGANPLLTISAVAERCCEIMAEERGWTIDYSMPPAPARLPALRPVGLKFTERMAGYIGTQVATDYREAAREGEKLGATFELTLTVIADDLDHFLRDHRTAAKVLGTAVAPALSAHPITVTEGTFRLGVPMPEQVNTSQMLYRLLLTTEEGKRYLLRGFKLLRDDPGLDPWTDTTTLFIDVHDGGNDLAPLVGKGILRMCLPDFLVQMQTLEATNAKSLFQARSSELRFHAHFARTLMKVYGGLVSRPRLLDPTAPPRAKRPLALGPAEIQDFETADGLLLRLTRFTGGAKGPVILAPGVGTSTRAYMIDTIETTLAEFLYARGYDVWLFDYRGSPALAAARTQFTLDEIAKYDYPAAVEKVRAITGAKDVQILGHCVASVTLLMSLLSGLEHVRTAICSQFATHVEQPVLQRIKCHSHLADVLPWFAIGSLTPHFGRTVHDWAYEVLLRLYPTYEYCDSPVCRRILFMYGEVYRHGQLNDATHRAIHEMFGIANMTTFRHLTRMIRTHRAVDFRGRNVYLPNVKNLGATRIAFLQGAQNRLFEPKGTQLTYEWLCENNGPERYSRRVIDGYGHMDCFIGRDAARDVFPAILEELETGG